MTSFWGVIDHAFIWPSSSLQEQVNRTWQKLLQRKPTIPSFLLYPHLTLCPNGWERVKSEYISSFCRGGGGDKLEDLGNWFHSEESVTEWRSLVNFGIVAVLEAVF